MLSWGTWVHIDPQRAGPDGVKELRRCIDKKSMAGDVATVT
jgi:hypothetical protein